MPLSPNLRGALYMAVAMAAFAMNDTLTKYASQAMNMGQVMLVRGVFATVLVAAIAWRSGALAKLQHLRNPMIPMRVFGELTGTVTFLIALAHLPLANVSAVMQALPLAVTMGAALIYGEPVRWRRWLAIAVGFAGVTVIVRPGFDGFSVFSLLALLSVACCTLRDLATRRLPAAVPTLLVSTATAAAVTLAGAVLMPVMGGWRSPPAADVALLALAAVLLLIGYHFIIEAMRVGAISFVAPFRYTTLLWSILLGYLVFGDVPDAPMLLGAAIIVASGLYMLYRERVLGRDRPAAASTRPELAADGL